MSDDEISETWNDMQKHIPEKWNTFLKAFAQMGNYGRDPMGILVYLARLIIVTFPNVKRELILGLLAMGYDDEWIMRNVPGGDESNKYPLKCVHEDWDKELSKIRQKREKTTVRKDHFGGK